MRRLGLKCGKNMKRLGLHGPEGLSDATIKTMGLFAAVEILELPDSERSNTIASVVEQLPKLRHLKLPMCRPPRNARILSCLLKCQTIERITIDLRSNLSMGPLNKEFFNEFIEIIKRRHLASLPRRKSFGERNVCIGLDTIFKTVHPI